MARVGGWLLRRILRHKCAAFCAACRSLEMLIACLEIVLSCDQRRVAQPSGGDMIGKLLDPIAGTGCSEVVEQARPGLYTRTNDDTLELRSEVNTGKAKTWDYPFGSRFCFIEQHKGPLINSVTAHVISA